MSMSTRLIGFKPPDEKFQKMKAVWDACVAAGIAIPDGIYDYFDGVAPDPAGVSVDLTNWDGSRASADKQGAVKSLGEGNGFEVDLRRLPPDVVILRFVNSW